MDLKKFESESELQYVWRLGKAKDEGLVSMTWDELANVFNKNLRDDESTYYTSSAYRKRYEMARLAYDELFKDNSNDSDIDAKLAELRRERMKLQTLNLENVRTDRNRARQELYYEYIGNACEALPWPEFQPLALSDDNTMQYVLTIADLHYGATFKSVNNEYSPRIAKERLQLLLARTRCFVNEHHIHQISVVCLGDVLQGILRVSDLKLNDSSVVKSVVEASRLIATFINDLSATCVVDYYHVPSANHTQIRLLGTKASEIADEDLEYIIGHYIQDLCIANDRVHVHLAEDGEQYIPIDIEGSMVLAGHGHTIKNTNTALRDLSMLYDKCIDYLLLGHFHGEKSFSVNESVCSDKEVIICPSFVGSDPYSDKLARGSKAAAKIYGFDALYGMTESYKFILN